MFRFEHRKSLRLNRDRFLQCKQSSNVQIVKHYVFNALLAHSHILSLQFVRKVFDIFFSTFARLQLPTTTQANWKKQLRVFLLLLAQF